MLCFEVLCRVVSCQVVLCCVVALVLALVSNGWINVCNLRSIDMYELKIEFALQVIILGSH